MCDYMDGYRDALCEIYEKVTTLLDMPYSEIVKRYGSIQNALKEELKPEVKDG